MAYLFAAIVCSALITIVMKAGSSADENPYSIVLGNYLTCVILSFVSIPERSALLHPYGSTLLLGLVGGALYPLGLIAIQRSISTHGVALTSAFSKLGMLVSLFISVLLFHEVPSMFQWIGIFLVIPAIFLIYHSPASSLGTASFGLLFLTMVSNGLAEAMAKIFREFGFASQAEVYLFILFLIASGITFGLWLRYAHRHQQNAGLRSIASGIAVGIPNYCSSLFLLRALSSIPAILAYPLFSAGSMLLVLTAGKVLFHESHHRLQMVGIFMIVGSLILLNC